MSGGSTIILDRYYKNITDGLDSQIKNVQLKIIEEQKNKKLYLDKIADLSGKINTSGSAFRDKDDIMALYNNFKNKSLEAQSLPSTERVNALISLQEEVQKINKLADDSKARDKELIEKTNRLNQNPALFTDAQLKYHADALSTPLSKLPQLDESNYQERVDATKEIQSMQKELEEYVKKYGERKEFSKTYSKGGFNSAVKFSKVANVREDDIYNFVDKFSQASPTYAFAIKQMYPNMDNITRNKLIANQLFLEGRNEVNLQENVVLHERAKSGGSGGSGGTDSKDDNDANTFRQRLILGLRDNNSESKNTVLSYLPQKSRLDYSVNANGESILKVNIPQVYNPKGDIIKSGVKDLVINLSQDGYADKLNNILDYTGEKIKISKLHTKGGATKGGDFNFEPKSKVNNATPTAVNEQGFTNSNGLNFNFNQPTQTANNQQVKEKPKGSNGISKEKPKFDATYLEEYLKKQLKGKQRKTK